MKILTIILFCVAGLSFINPAFATNESLKDVILIDINGKSHDIIKESFNQPIILVRYLGANCSKCLHQLNTLNALSDTLKSYKLKVMGFSNDDIEQNKKILKQAKFNNSVVSLYSDNNSKSSINIGSTIEEINGDKTERHATLLIYKGKIYFKDIDAKPYMYIGKLIDLFKDQIAGYYTK
jgi:peroxiredoxin